jgi:hypothetical protein
MRPNIQRLLWVKKRTEVAVGQGHFRSSPRTDINQRLCQVRFVPTTDIAAIVAYWIN